MIASRGRLATFECVCANSTVDSYTPMDREHDYSEPHNPTTSNFPPENAMPASNTPTRTSCFHFHPFLSRPLNKRLNPLTLPNLLKRLLRLLKLHPSRNKLLDTQSSTRDQLHCERVVARAVPETALDRQLFRTHGRNGPSDVVRAHTTLHVGSPDAQSVDRGLDAGFGARGVDDRVGSGAEFGFFDQVGCILLGAHAGRAEKVRGCVFLRELQTVLINIDSHDFSRAKGLGDGAAEESDRAGAEDDDGLPGLDGCLLCDVHADGEGLDERAFFHADVVWELVAEVLRQLVVPCQSPIIRRRSRKPHIDTQIIVPLLTPIAPPTRDSRFHAHAVAGFEARDGLTDLGYDSGAFVAQDHGGFDDEGADGAVGPVVHVGAADAGVFYIDQDFVGVGEGWDGAVFEGDGEGFLEDKGGVLCHGVNRVSLVGSNCGIYGL